MSSESDGENGELSKWLMYDFYYNFLLVKSPSTRVVYMDTDSFITSSTDNVYEQGRKYSELFDKQIMPLEFLLI